MKLLHTRFYCLYIFLLVTTGAAQAQQSCDCNENLADFIKKFEMSYAGFQFKTEKNKPAYLLLKETLLKKSSNSKNLYECYNIIKKYTDFFYDKHILRGLRYDSANKNEIKNIFSKFKSTYPNIQSLAAVWDKQKKDSIEGYWKDVRGILYYIRKESPTLYSGYVVEGDSIFWFPGQKRLQLQKQNNYYKISVFSKEREELVSYNHITKIFIKLSASHVLFRINDTFKIQQEVFYEAISNDTGIFSVQSFSGKNYYTIDSIIAANLWHIKKIKCLFIDLRNNTGGGFGTVEKLLPYIFTKPAPYTFYELSSPLSNASLKKYLNDTLQFSSALLNEWKIQSDWLEKHPGEFLEEKYFKTLPDTATVYPQKVYVLVNEHSWSAAEMFAKYLKDNSSKVTLYGRNTGGYIDYGNIINAELPCKGMYFYVPCGHSSWVPKQAYDRTGLPPDVYIPYEITDWIKYITQLNR